MGGEALVPGDPRSQNKNGKLFQEFLERNPNLSIVNALSLCEGLITRKRLREGQIEGSVLDFFIVCSKVLPFVKRMVIDENKDFILTNYNQVGKTGKAVDSDHLTEYMDLDIKIEPQKPERIEIFNFKEEESKVKFKKFTSETNEFTQCFEDKKPLFKQIQNWQQMLRKFCNKSFKKIRIKKKSIKPLKEPLKMLINQRNVLMKQPDSMENKNKLEETTNEIYEIEAEENRNKIVKNFKTYSDDPENINMQEMWRILKRIFPKAGSSLPVAKKNHRGKIVSGAKDIKKLLAKEYKDRLRCRPIRPDLSNTKIRRNSIFNMKMKLAETRHSPDWKMSDLD